MVRRLMICMLVLIGCNVVLAANKPLSSTRFVRTSNENDEVIPGIVIVKFKRQVDITDGSLSTSSTVLNDMLHREGVLSLKQIFEGLQHTSQEQVAEGAVDLSRIYYAFVPADVNPRSVASALTGLDDIEYAEPKYMSYLNDTPNDPQLGNQNNAFTRMNAYNGWTIAKGDMGVPIAVVDGGTYWPHEDLNPNLHVNALEDVNHNGVFDPGPPPAGDEDGIDQDGNGFTDDVIGWNFANSTNDPRGLPGTPQSAAHGTATASHFGARTNNGIGMAGSSWNCSLLPVCAASPTSDNGIAFGYEGIAYAYLNGAKIINCSWGRTGGYSLFEQDVITAASQAGALVVAAAGNGTNNNGVGKNNDVAPDYPPNYKNLLAVGATNSTSDTKASFSNYGRTIPVYAPGVSIWSAFNGGGYGNGGSGTSYSSPLVAGLAGIVKSLHPSWSPVQIATQIRVTADSIDGVNPSYSGNMGRGRVNFARALSESHAGIAITNSSIVATRGGTLYLPGDTVVVTLTVTNVLFVDATNLTFTATTSDASLQVLQGSASAGTLAAGQSTTLAPLMFKVGALTTAKDVIIRLAWVSNGNERDSYGFKVTIFPSIPQWETQASPTQTSLFSVRAVSPTVAWASGGNGSATAPVVIRTADGGESWTDVTGNLSGVDLYCVFGLDENRAWVGTGDGRIFATIDGGVSWNQQVYPGTQSPFIDGVWFFDTNNGYAMGDPATANRWVVLRTSDGGATWAHLTNEPVGVTGEAGWNNSFWWTDINNGWIGTNKAKVWHTTDGGTTWSSGSTSNTDSYGISFKDPNNGLATHSNGAIRVTTNGGALWTAVASPTSSPIIGVSYLNGTSSAWVAVGTTPYRSINNGTSWSPQTLYPFTGSLQHISFVDTSNGWAVTSNGEVLKYRLQGTTGVDPESLPVIPVEFSLAQNYPNPFNPSTRIGFRVTGSGRVALKVYDLLGREVATLVDEHLKPGSYERVFDASTLASGVYIYKLQSGSNVTAKKMLLLR